MNYLKKIKSIEEQLKFLPKLYRSHVWVTPPASDGLSFLGISQYAKHYFLRMKTLNFQEFSKTTYGLANREYLKAYVESTRTRRDRNQLLLSQRLEWERFQVKQGESFSMLETLEFDVELQAPLDMRVVEINFNVEYYINLLSSPFYFRIDMLSPQQLSKLEVQQQYRSSRQMMMS